jgi:hypothetical protein
MVLLLLVQAAATWFMTGVIWLVQIVHYPLFVHVGPDDHAAFHRRHMRLITWIVAPVMLVEAGTALAMTIWLPAGVQRWQALLGAALVVGLWVSTALLQVPAHERLAQGFEEAKLRRLVHGNWVRTVMWTLRAVLVLWMLAAFKRAGAV